MEIRLFIYIKIYTHKYTCIYLMYMYEFMIKHNTDLASLYLEISILTIYMSLL